MATTSPPSYGFETAFARQCLLTPASRIWASKAECGRRVPNDPPLPAKRWSLRDTARSRQREATMPSIGLTEPQPRQSADERPSLSLAVQNQQRSLHHVLAVASSSPAIQPANARLSSPSR